MNDRRYSSFNTDCPPNLLIEGARRHSSFDSSLLVDAYSGDVRGIEMIHGFDTDKMVVLSSYSLPETIQIRDSENIEVVKSFRSLENNWDGYGANRPSEEAIENSIQLIRAIESSVGYKVDICYPLDNGGIQVDVSSSYFGYELEVFDDSFELLKFDQNNSIIDTMTLSRETIAFIAKYF